MLLLKNGTHINWKTLEFSRCDLLVKEGPAGDLIVDPDPSETAGAKVIDCKGKYITRSFACGHHHVYSALSRGMGAPKKNPENFNEILQYIWWTLDKSLDTRMIYSSALVTAMACARNGLTFVIDHHASPFAIKQSLETIARAFDEVGVGHLLCYEISDRDGSAIASEGLDETLGYLSQNQGLVGLHASFTVGNETLRQAVSLAGETGTGLHVHVAEAATDQDHCVKTYGKRVIERFADAGVLASPKTILVHCLHLNETERKLVAGSPAWVAMNMDSNLNNRVGFFNSEGLGNRIMLGTDGMHSDMLQSARSAFFAGQNFDTIDYAETYRRFRNVHNYLAENNFTGDGDNNLVVLDYDPPTPFHSGNFLGHFLFGISSAHVQHLISRGKLIVHDRKIITVDEEKILSEARNQAARLWEKMRS